MTSSKIKKLLTEALEKYGNIDVLQLIDYYYQETYEGSNNWKVREKLSIQDLIDNNVDSTYSIDDISIRDILKYLETEDKAIKYLPIKVSVFYEDSRLAAEKMRAEHPEEERQKQETLARMGSIFMRNNELIRKFYI